MTTPTPSTPLPSPPFHNIPNTLNLRTATHSLTTTSGSPLRPGILFRSADISNLNLSGWQALHALGVSYVFDLRSKPEIDKVWTAKDEDVKEEWERNMREAGVKRLWVPVFEETDYSPERLAERYGKYMDEGVKGFVSAYQDILENGGVAFGRILRYLVDLAPPRREEEEEGEEGKVDKGVLVHCTAGKDRTGIFFGVLFAFLGVSREAIAEEYHRTEMGLACVQEDVLERVMVSQGFRKYIEEQMAIESPRGGEGAVPPQVMEKAREAALRMIGAKKESILKSLEMLEVQFGGAEAYMKEKCGLSDEELSRLRENLVLKL
jgi:protein tyrosine/serine phosphatase